MGSQDSRHQGGEVEKMLFHLSRVEANNATDSGGHEAATFAKGKGEGSGTYTGVIATENEVGCCSRKETPLWQKM